MVFSFFMELAQGHSTSKSQDLNAGTLAHRSLHRALSQSTGSGVRQSGARGPENWSACFMAPKLFAALCPNLLFQASPALPQHPKLSVRSVHSASSISLCPLLSPLLLTHHSLSEAQAGHSRLPLVC